MKFYQTSIEFRIQSFRPNQTKTFDLPRLKKGKIGIIIEESTIIIPPKSDPENPGSGSSIHSAKGVTAQVVNGTAIIAEGGDSFYKVNYIEGGGFQLKVKNSAQLRKYVRITVNYVSNRLILEKKIPLAFFQQAFDTFWNKVQPIKSVQIKNNVLNINWDNDFKDALELPEIVKDLGQIYIPLNVWGDEPFPDITPDTYVTVKQLITTKIEFSASTKSYLNKQYPSFCVQLNFNDSNDIGLTTYPDASIKDFAIKIEFLLYAYKRLDIIIVPKIYGQVNGFGPVDGTVDDRIDKALPEKITEALSKYVQDYSFNIQKWFLGGEFDLYSLKVKDDIIIIEYAENPIFIASNDNTSVDISSIPADPAISSSHLISSSFGEANIRPVGKLKEIDHIVVLMMENRSFDQMLGYLSLESRTNKSLPNHEVNGLKEEKFDSWANEYNGEKFPPCKLEKDEIHIKTSPNHGYLPVKDQKAYNMKGFVTDFANIEGLEDDPKVIMGYYDDKQLEVYAQLSNEFLVCDHWYCAFPGGTWPNRFITLSGNLQTKPDGSANYNNPGLSEFYPLHDKTLFDVLTEKNVSWKYFEHGYCFLRLYAKYTYDMKNIIDANNHEKGFFELAKKGQLPSVSFIDPDFIEYPPGNDDHAPAHPHCGQKLIGKIVNALMSNAKAWKKTLLIITYDEHGGFYDHVNPEVDEPAPPISGTLKEYGIRVPTIVVSPWVKKGGYTNKLLDHTSIAATIFRRFCSPNIPDMGARTNKALDLEHVIEDNVRKNIPKIIIPEYPDSDCEVFDLRTPKVSPKIDGTKGEDDFHELLLMASMFGRAPK